MLERSAGKKAMYEVVDAVPNYTYNLADSLGTVLHAAIPIATVRHESSTYNSAVVMFSFASNCDDV